MNEAQAPEVQIERQGFTFRLNKPWDETSLDTISNALQNHSHSTQERLGGRGTVQFVQIPAVGSVAVKQYKRGGLLSLFVKERYLNAHTPRPAVEWQTLKTAKELGVNVPEPLGFATSGSLLYRAWLFTEEIPKHRALTDIAIQGSIRTELSSESANQDSASLPKLIADLVEQVGKLINSGIQHIDLHPGNVVVSDTGRVYILDFDKAKQVNLEKRELRDQYVWRWRRAVIKHGLPEELSELFCLGLRQSAIVD